MFKDSFFNKIEKRTNINKDTIMSLAQKLQNNDMKDENVLSDLVDEIGALAGKEVSPEKKNKIINAIVQDKVPTNLDKMI